MKIWICLCANQSFCVCMCVCGTSVEVIWSIPATETNAVRMLMPECTNHILDDSMVMIMIYVHTHILLHYSFTICMYTYVCCILHGKKSVWFIMNVNYLPFQMANDSTVSDWNGILSATYSKRNGILYINIIHQLDMPCSCERRQWVSERMSVRDWIKKCESFGKHCLLR